MKICIVGAGAIGGLLAVRLAQAGAHVSVIARGTQLKAIQTKGLTLIEADGQEKNARFEASSRITDMLHQDAIILAVKAHQLADASFGVAQKISQMPAR